MITRRGLQLAPERVDPSLQTLGAAGAPGHLPPYSPEPDPIEPAVANLDSVGLLSRRAPDAGR